MIYKQQIFLAVLLVPDTKKSENICPLNSQFKINLQMD